MNSEARMLVLLDRAQGGDEEATRHVALHVFETYKHRIRKLYVIDPAVSGDDLESTFFEGIVRAIQSKPGMVARWKTNGGAHPLSHLGQRGVWNVMSEIRSLRAALVGRDFSPVFSEGEEPMITDRTGGDFREVVIDQHHAEQRVRIVANANLRGRSRQVVDLILDGSVGDPTEKGFNQRLSKELQVTPQRASQIMASLREEVKDIAA